MVATSTGLHNSLYRKIKDISDLGRWNLLIYQIEKVAELLAEGKYKITGFQLLWEVALKVT